MAELTVLHEGNGPTVRCWGHVRTLTGTRLIDGKCDCGWQTGQVDRRYWREVEESGRMHGEAMRERIDAAADAIRGWSADG